MAMSAMFEGTLVKWGTFSRIRIPKPIRDGMKLSAGDKIRLILEENKVMYRKNKKKKLDFLSIIIVYVNIEKYRCYHTF